MRRDLIPGGYATVRALSRDAYGAYLWQRDSSSTAALAAVVTLMLWAHYNGHAFFLGAAFTAAHAERRRALAEGSKGDILNTA